MSTTYLVSYIIFAIIVLATINYFYIKKPKFKRAIENEEPSEEQQMSVGKIMFVLLFGMFVAILNQTVLNVALPVMMTDLNVSATTGQWLLTGFMLVNGMLIPISAFLVETFGFRKLFIAAMVSFTLGSLICAVSGTFVLIMVGRVVQAIGAGILMPLGMNIFMTVFPPEKRGAAMGTMGIAMILAPALGPTLSGWIVQNFDWHIMFYGMVVFGVIDILFAIRWFKIYNQLSKPTPDILGIIYSSLGFGSLLYGFSEAGTDGWGSAEVIVSLIIGVIFLVIFTWRQLKIEKPLLDLHVFKFNIYTFTLIINSIVTMAMYGGMLLLPIYLQNIRGFTPIESGLLLLPGSLVMGFMGPIAGKIFDKHGIRVLAIVGLSITTIATYEFTKLTGQTPYKTILTFYIIRSFGMSLIMMPIMTAGMNQLPMKLISHGTALSNTIRQVAGSIGTALLVTIMTQQTTNHLDDYGHALTKTDLILSNSFNQIGQGVSAALGIPSGASDTVSTSLIYAQAAKTSTIHGINDAFLIATILAFVATVLSFFLQKPKQNSQNEELPTNESANNQRTEIEG